MFKGFWWVILRLYLIFSGILLVILGIMGSLKLALAGILVLFLVLLIEDLRRW